MCFPTLLMAWDKQIFDDLYDSSYKGEILHYDRRVLFRMMEDRAHKYKRIFEAHGVAQDELAVLVVGCGMGWSCEVMERDFGWDCVGTEPSDWIESVLNTDREKYQGHVSAKIIHKYLYDEGAIDSVNNAFSNVGPPDVVVVEDVIPGYDDTELEQFIALDSIWPDAPTYLLITPKNEEENTQVDFMNWKSMADWRIFFNDLGKPHYKLINAETYEVS